MTLTAIVVKFAVGLIAGLLSGLVGIGGGVLMVPFLYFFYDRPEWFGVAVPMDLRVVVAHATSLFVIVPTSVRGVVAFHGARLVEWRAVWPIGLASVFAAVIAARLALFFPPEILKFLFGTFLVVSGLRLAKRRPATEPGAEAAPLRLSWKVTVPIGITVGAFSALLGVGGGVVTIPLLMYVVRLDVRKIAATSIAIIAITATAGTLTYMAMGLGHPGLPVGSIGYVHAVVGVAMFVGAVLSVRSGAMLNQRLKPRMLNLVFAVLFVVIGIRLVVASAWILGQRPGPAPLVSYTEAWVQR
ncbi:sulfite exporter TauE/SafE family protein [soil metagenome]